MKGDDGQIKDDETVPVASCSPCIMEMKGDGETASGVTEMFSACKLPVTKIAAKRAATQEVQVTPKKSCLIPSTVGLMGTSEACSGVVKMYSPYKLAVERKTQEYTPVKTPAAQEVSVTPKKRKLECFKQYLVDSLDQVDTNITSALYSIGKLETKEATAKLEKTRNVVKSVQQKGNGLLHEIHLERCSHVQKIESLTARELFLHRENVKQADIIKAIEKQIKELKLEIGSLKEEQSFQNDSDDDLLE